MAGFSAAVPVQHLEGVEGGIRGHPHHAAGVAPGGDNAGHVGSVTVGLVDGGVVVVHGVVVTVDEVVPPLVVVAQFRVGIVDTAVGHGDLDPRAGDPLLVIEAAADTADPPGALVLVSTAGRHPGATQRWVGWLHRPEHPVRFHVSHPRISSQELNPGCRNPRRDGADKPELASDLPPCGGNQGALSGAHRTVEADDHPIPVRHGRRRPTQRHQEQQDGQKIVQRRRPRRLCAWRVHLSAIPRGTGCREEPASPV